MPLVLANKQELNYWTERRYSAAELAEYYQEIAPCYHVVKYVWDGGKNIQYYSRAQEKISADYVITILTFFGEVVALGNVEPFELLVSVHDSLWEDAERKIPLLGFAKSKRDLNGVLIADPSYVSGNGYVRQLDNILEMSKIVPWSERINGAFWIGRTTGHPNLTKDRWSENLRIKLCLVAKEINNPQTLRASIAQICQCDDREVRGAIWDTGIVTGEVGFHDFFRYRFQIDIDGNTSAWGFFWKLLMGPVIRIDSCNEQWFHRFLSPWEHYIPVKSDMSDLLLQIEWAQTHEQECLEIHRRAMNVVIDNMYENVLRSGGELINRLTELKR